MEPAKNERATIAKVRSRQGNWAKVTKRNTSHKGIDAGSMRKMMTTVVRWKKSRSLRNSPLSTRLRATRERNPKTTGIAPN